MVAVEEVESDLADEQHASGGGGGPAAFEQLLQLASHIKSNDPDVRAKRERWQSLLFHQKNSVLFQQQDAGVRYDLLATPRPEGAEAAAASSACAAADSSAVATAAPSLADSAAAVEASAAAVPARTAAAHASRRFDSVRLPQAKALKARAADAYARKQWSDASMLYQRAIGLFQWARKQSTKDGDEMQWMDLLAALPTHSPPADTHSGQAASEVEAVAASTDVFHRTLPELSAVQRARAAQLVFTCLVNIGACEAHLEQWDSVVQVSEAALSMNMRAGVEDVPSKSDEPPFPLTTLTVKALYRCAHAYHQLDDLDKAVRLLQRAAKLSPKDASVSRLLSELRAEQQRQAEHDQRSFGGLFGRGDIVEADEQGNVRSAFDSADGSSAHVAATDGSSSSNLPVVSPLAGNNGEKTKQFLNEYISGFRAQQQRDAAATAGKSKPSTAATASPTSAAAAAGSSPAQLATMYAQARDHFGIDLSDPLVQEELRRLQEQHRTGKYVPGQAHDDAPPTGSGSAARAPAASKSASSGKVQSGLPDLSMDANAPAWVGPAIFVVLLAAALHWMGAF